MKTKEPNGEVALSSKLLSVVTGYARHPQCDQKIYRPFSRFVPGKCGRCGASINMPCSKWLLDRDDD
ncbi:MAG TPA: hypothetical protein VL728_18500 [Cyclobacteriaceae bacterium]|nr:hypothetical protein [Cyclobacteriaceae bacterium]